MNYLILLAEFAVPSANSLIGLLFTVAIICVVVWAIVALVRWAFPTFRLPEPVRIILIALACIVAIIFLFRLFGILVA